MRLADRRTHVFLNIMMSAFFLAVLWEYVPAVPSLSRAILESVVQGMFDDEAAIFVGGFLLLGPWLWLCDLSSTLLQTC